MVRKITGDRHVAIVERLEPRGMQALQEFDVAIGLSVVLTAGYNEPVRSGTPRTW